jgi:hypothetical protein
LQARRSARRGRGSRRGRRRGRRRRRSSRRRTPRSPGRGARGWGGRWRSSRRRRRRRRMWRWRRRRRGTHRCRGRWRRRFRRGGRRRRRRLPNLGLRRRRCGPWWRSGTRGRARMRCGCGRRALWRSLGLALWWPFGPSLGTDFALRLRNDDRPGLRLRRRARELHRRQGGRGKQRDTKVCHDDLGPRKSFGIKRFSQPNGFGVTINSQPLGRNVAAAKRSGSFILPAQGVTRALVHDAFRGRFQIVVPHCPLRHIGHAGFPPLKTQCRSPDWPERARWGRALEPRPVSCPAVHQAAAAPRVRAPAGEPRAADCPAETLVAARLAGLALQVEFRAARSALRRDLHQPRSSSDNGPDVSMFLAGGFPARRCRVRKF